MLAPKPHLLPQQPIRDTQVLQLPQEFIQRVMLVVVAAEVFQRITERVVRRTHQTIQGDQRQGQKAQTLALQNELAALEQRHARVVFAFALVLHGGKALRADFGPAVIGSRELPLAVTSFAVTPHALAPIRCRPAKPLPFLNNHLRRVSRPAQMQRQRTDNLEASAGDRKSTRLNSSHGYISYAVFCLKTKKT